MAYYFSPVGNSPWVDSNGDPLVGGYWSFFLAGTSTPVAVYTDNTGTVAQPADLTLQSNGMPFSPIWLQGGIAVKARLFTSAGVAVANGTFDNISGIDDPAIASSVDQWVPYTGAATYISATSFSLAGDQTNTFQVLRRVRTVNTGGTVYSSISVSSFGAGITTVTVVNDSGTLDSGLSAVSYGLLSANNDSIPESTIGAALRVSASAAAAQLAIATTGTVLQKLVFTDAGSSTGSSSLTSITGSAKSITPRSSNSTLLVEVTFDASITAGGAATNTIATFQLYNNTTAANIGAAYVLGTSSSAGANLQTQGMGVVRASISNAALTAVGFILRAQRGATAATAAGANHVWTITEIQN